MYRFFSSCVFKVIHGAPDLVMAPNYQPSFCLLPHRSSGTVVKKFSEARNVPQLTGQITKTDLRSSPDGGSQQWLSILREVRVRRIAGFCFCFLPPNRRAMTSLHARRQGEWEVLLCRNAYSAPL
ncbi:hypothetical protein PYCCODRAFT_971715 [Trametes coccinea BRFM310]|uniref:Uncharacterized protein n=1 Tax=Trametes coccinea (strain BRFM310) TaxID=1353009 RepID=A0A1Y2IFA9_TRAC3|nr:hypothetical protein PYCCODRAFT_971715 [Trametes coccinea BRFM310]